MSRSTPDYSLSQSITVDLSSSAYYNMSTTNNTKKTSSPTPWNDWKMDAEFISEINKYCDDHNAKFFDIVENTIKGLRKVEEILVLY